MLSSLMMAATGKLHLGSKVPGLSTFQSSRPNLEKPLIPDLEATKPSIGVRILGVRITLGPEASTLPCTCSTQCSSSPVLSHAKGVRSEGLRRIPAQCNRGVEDL